MLEFEKARGNLKPMGLLTSDSSATSEVTSVDSKCVP